MKYMVRIAKHSINTVQMMTLAAVLALLVPMVSRAGAFPVPARAQADIDTAIAQAQHKRVLVAFGADWCPDCRVLATLLARPENEMLLKADYVLVRVNVGRDGITDNFDIAKRYGIPLKKGVPALAVLDAEGKLIYAQQNGEFESMRGMDPKSVNEFLNRWKP